MNRSIHFFPERSARAVSTAGELPSYHVSGMGGSDVSWPTEGIPHPAQRYITTLQGGVVGGEQGAYRLIFDWPHLTGLI